jgi:hypothetical protein
MVVGPIGRGCNRLFVTELQGFYATNNFVGTNGQSNKREESVSLVLIGNMRISDRVTYFRPTQAG